MTEVLLISWSAACHTPTKLKLRDTILRHKSYCKSSRGNNPTLRFTSLHLIPLHPFSLFPLFSFVYFWPLSGSETLSWYALFQLMKQHFVLHHKHTLLVNHWNTHPTAFFPPPHRRNSGMETQSFVADKITWIKFQVINSQQVFLQ